jgi:hypothetical protein
MEDNYKYNVGGGIELFGVVKFKLWFKKGKNFLNSIHLYNDANTCIYLIQTDKEERIIIIKKEEKNLKIVFIDLNGQILGVEVL